MNELNETTPQTGVPMPSSQRVFVRALRWSVITTVVLIIAFAIIGHFVSGEKGLYGGLIGAAGAGIFLMMTVGSMAFANRFHTSDMYLPMFFGIVAGTWVLKLVIFIVGALLLRSQEWLDPKILFIAVVCGAIVSLIIDTIVVLKTRIPIIDSPE